MLQRKHGIEPLPATGNESGATLLGCQRILLIEFGKLVVTQKLIGRRQRVYPTQPYLLRQTPLPSAETVFTTTVRSCE